MGRDLFPARLEAEGVRAASKLMEVRKGRGFSLPPEGPLREEGCDGPVMLGGGDEQRLGAPGRRNACSRPERRFVKDAPRRRHDISVIRLFPRRFVHRIGETRGKASLAQHEGPAPAVPAQHDRQRRTERNRIGHHTRDRCGIDGHARRAEAAIEQHLHDQSAERVSDQKRRRG